MLRENQKVVCSLIVEVLDEYDKLYDTITVSYDKGYVLDGRDDYRYLIEQTKDYCAMIGYDNVRIWLYDQNGMEIWL